MEEKKEFDCEYCEDTKKVEYMDYVNGKATGAVEIPCECVLEDKWDEDFDYDEMRDNEL